jgi:hypothetical protein
MGFAPSAEAISLECLPKARKPNCCLAKAWGEGGSAALPPAPSTLDGPIIKKVYQFISPSIK